MIALCCVCGAEEGRDRCCWPMPDSPASFGAWDDALDREILAERLGGGFLYEEDVAKLMGTSGVAIRQRSIRGTIPRQLPQDEHNQARRWDARDLVGFIS